MSQQWFYTRAGTKYGPVSPAELKQLASRDPLAPTDLVWKEGMPEWVPAVKIKGLCITSPAATSPPPLPVTLSEPSLSIPHSTEGVRGPLKMSLWTYLLAAGVGLLFVAFFTPWWSFKEHRSEGRSRDRNGEDEHAFWEEQHRFKRENIRKNAQWYNEHVKYDMFAGFHEASLWGWSTGPGLMGFIFVFLIAGLIVPALIIPVLARWAWIGAFVSAFLGLLTFIFSMIWFFRAPGASMAGVLSQGVIIGPWFSMIGGLAVVAGGILDGLRSLKLLRPRTVSPQPLSNSSVPASELVLQSAPPPVPPASTKAMASATAQGPSTLSSPAMVEASPPNETPVLPPTIDETSPLIRRHLNRAWRQRIYRYCFAGLVLCGLVVGIVLVLNNKHKDSEQDPGSKFGKIKEGMTAKQVKDILGEPAEGDLERNGVCYWYHPAISKKELKDVMKGKKQIKRPDEAIAIEFQNNKVKSHRIWKGDELDGPDNRARFEEDE